MKQYARRLGRGAAVYGLGGIVQRFFGIFLLPFFTRALSPADYGILALINLLVLAVGGFVTLGTGNSLSVLYFREKMAEARQAIIWNNVILVFVNGLVISSVLILAAPAISRMMFESPSHAPLLRVAFLSLWISSVRDVFYSYLRLEEKATIFVAFTIVDSALVIVSSIYLVLVLHLGVAGMLWAMVASRIVMLFVLLITVAAKLPFKLNLTVQYALAKIGFPAVFGVFAFMLIDYADRQLVQRFLGIQQLGVYSVSYNFGLVMMLFVGAFSSAWPPFFMSFIEKQDEARKIFGRLLTYYTLAFGSLTVLFFASAKPLLVFFTAPQFHSGYVVVGIIAGAYMLKGFYLILLPGIYFARKLYLQTGIEWTAAMVNISLNLILIPRYGIIGAALATLAGYAFLCLLSWLVSRSYLKVEYEWNRVAAALIAASLVSIAILTFSQNTQHGERSLLFNACMLGAYAGFVYIFLLKDAERSFLHDFARQMSERLST